MAVSGNGWPVDPNPAVLGIENFMVNGATFPVRGGKVRQILEYVAVQVNNRVERANATYGCWGYSYRANVNNPGVWSNHASGTAIDFNATRHPNGVPASANFTPAQIAEIHKILAEVGGVVRWGGDYNGTPDAMHFEINVSPDQLDVQIDPSALPTGGATPAGYGAPTLDDGSKLPVLTENSVSLPTLMNYGHGYAQWLFKPTQSGFISIDGMLSHYSDPSVEAATPGGPAIRLYIFPVTYGSDGSLIPRYAEEIEAMPWPGNDDFPARNTGQMSVEVEAGRTYVIRATTTPEYPWIKAVVRIGGFAKVSDWITPPPVEAVLTVRSRVKDPISTIESLYFPSVIDSGSGDDWMYGTGDPGWIYHGVLMEGPRYTSRYKISTSIFGRAPWAISAGTEAMECAWRWARRYRGEQDWSPGDGISWYGPPLSELSFPDHIYPANGAGSASCRFRTDVDQAYIDTYGITDPLGVIYYATPPGLSWDGEAHNAALYGQFTHGDVIWEAYSGSYTCDFDVLRLNAGPSGWGGAWAGPDWAGNNGTDADEGFRPDYMPDIFDGEAFGPTAEWESEEPATITKVEFALDEYTFPTSYVVGEGVADPHQAYPQDHRKGAGSVINWYAQRVQPAENVEGWTTSDWLPAGPHPYTMWGPWGNNTWYGQAAGDGPAAFAASAQLLASTSGGNGGTWRTLDPSFWALANDRVLDYFNLDSDIPVEISAARARPAVPAQVRFVAIPRAILTDSMPWTPASGYGEGEDESGVPGDGHVDLDYLQGQAVALRVTFQPQRYRIIYPAEIPDITYTGNTAIAMNSDGTGQVLY